MSQILKVLQMFLGIIPLVLIMIQSFETPGFGAEKKKVILDSVGLLYDQVGITMMTKDKVLGIIGSFIDIAVGFFNVVGWFKKSNPTPNT